MNADWGPEGYCKHCNRMVVVRDLHMGGQVIEFHQSGTGEYRTSSKPCPGTDTAPQKRVPKESRKHAFSYTPKVKATPRRHDDERG